jgi:hypothetical protein
MSSSKCQSPNLSKSHDAKKKMRTGMKQILVGKGGGDYPGSEMEDADADHLPVTDGREGTTSGNKDDDGAMAEVIALHRKTFMERAFSTDDEARTYTSAQQKSGSMTLCRTQEQLDKISYVIDNWNVGINSKKMDPGGERDELAAFCHEHYQGIKYAHQYITEQIVVPGSSVPRNVLRRVTKGF